MGNSVRTFLFLFSAFLIFTMFVYLKAANRNENNMSEEAIAGKMLYQKHNCTACHQLFGLGGYLGPELTTVISQPGKGSSYARALIKSGSAGMPDFHLNENEIKSLLAFLSHIDETADTYK